MSIYHCSIKIISRAGGRSAISAAAYRSGEKLTNEETGFIHDYTRKGGVIMNEIILPDNAPNRLFNREVLWNEVQHVEKRSDAQFAREVEVALPIELMREEQIECVRSFIRENFTSKGMIADWALHDKGDGNPHAHIMLTVRGINEKEGWQKKQKSVFANGRDKNRKPIYDPSKPSYDPNDKEGTSKYRIPALDENGKQKTRVREGKGTEYLWERISIPANDWNEHSKCEQWRKSWAEHCNRYLPPELHIDHRSYKRQGIDMEATVHEGVTARKMEQIGKTADRCEMNREIRQRNKLRQILSKQVNEISNYIVEKVRNIYERITGIFEDRKSRRTDRDSWGNGKTNEHYGGASGGKRETGVYDNISSRERGQSGKGTVSDENREVRAGRRNGRVSEIIGELERRKQEASLTDKGIDQTEKYTQETDIRIRELKRIKEKKEKELDERIRRLMDKRRSDKSDGRNAAGYGIKESADSRTDTIEKRTSDSAGTEGRTDSEALIRDIEAAIETARAIEGAADKEREAREAERSRLDREREREAERKRLAERERAERDYKKKRNRNLSR
jgi:hypothetical protein